MSFRRELFEAEILHPEQDFEPVKLQFEVRMDPLTGHTSRILPQAGFLPRTDFDLGELADSTRSDCPFCPERVETATPRLPARITAEGRIRHGEALLFPNLLPYSKYSSVSVYSPNRHFLPLDQLTPELMADNLSAQVEFAQSVLRHDGDASWVSINANHMLPSGSSVFHPHLQGSVNPVPTTVQRMLAETPAERFHRYVQSERDAGDRYIASTGTAVWLATFAPIGPAELRAFVFEVASPAELDRTLVEELAEGIATALNLYAELGFQSFNMALYGAPPETPGYPLNLRLVCRSNLEPLYRSDATWLERLHWEAAVDVVPEDLAARARSYFDQRIRRA
jgi:UDPglucose--hexose-1-phosphate uridylyltransferase